MPPAFRSARNFRARQIAVVLLYPGMVKTQMTGQNGIPAEVSVRGLLARVDAFCRPLGDELVTRELSRARMPEVHGHVN
jgi:hypothetical protein